jgi:tetratricopeptide (TPR) repeat protein
MKLSAEALALSCCALLLAACAGTAKKAAEAPVAAAPAATEPGKGDPEKRFADALALVKAHKNPEALAALTALTQDFPEYSGPYCALGVLDAQSRNREGAFASFAKAVAAKPDNAFAYDWLGILYRESGDYTNAEQAYLKAVAAKADDATAHLNLAILYDAYLHRPQDALTHYREYQRIAGTERTIVTAWIDELQDPSANRPAAAAPAPGGPAAVEQKQ